MNSVAYLRQQFESNDSQAAHRTPACPMSQSPKPLNRRLRASIDAKFSIDLTELGLQNPDDAFADQVASGKGIPETVIETPEPVTALNVPDLSDESQSSTDTAGHSEIVHVMTFAKPEVMLSTLNKAASVTKSPPADLTQPFILAHVEVREPRLEPDKEDHGKPTESSRTLHKAPQARASQLSTPTCTFTWTDPPHELKSPSSIVRSAFVLASASTTPIADRADETTVVEPTTTAVDSDIAHSSALAPRFASQSLTHDTTTNTSSVSARESRTTTLQDFETSVLEAGLVAGSGDIVLGASRSTMESEAQDTTTQTRRESFTYTSESDLGSKSLTQERTRRKRLARLERKNINLPAEPFTGDTAGSTEATTVEKDAEFIPEPLVGKSQSQPQVQAGHSIDPDQEGEPSTALNFLVQVETATQTEPLMTDQSNLIEEAVSTDDKVAEVSRDGAKVAVIEGEALDIQNNNTKGIAKVDEGESRVPNTTPDAIEEVLLDTKAASQPEMVQTEDHAAQDSKGGDDDMVVVQETIRAAGQTAIEDVSTDVATDSALINKTEENESRLIVDGEGPMPNKPTEGPVGEDSVPDNATAEDNPAEQAETGGLEPGEEAVGDRSTEKMSTEAVVVETTPDQAPETEKNSDGAEIIEASLDRQSVEEGKDNASVDAAMVESVPAEADTSADTYVDGNTIAEEGPADAAVREPIVNGPPPVDTPRVEPGLGPDPESGTPTAGRKSKRSVARNRNVPPAAAHRREKSKDKHRAAVWERDTLPSRSYRGPVLEKNRGEGGLFESAIARQIQKTKEARAARRDTEENKEYKEARRQRRKEHEKRDAEEREARSWDHAEMKKQEDIESAYEASPGTKKGSSSRGSGEQPPESRHERTEGSQRKSVRHRTRASGDSTSQQSDTDKPRPALLARLTSTGESDTRGPLFKLNIAKAGGYESQDMPRSRPTTAESNNPDNLLDGGDARQGHDRQRRRRPRKASGELSTTLDKGSQHESRFRAQPTREEGRGEHHGPRSNNSARRSTNATQDDTPPGLKLLRSIKAVLTLK